MGNDLNNDAVVIRPGEVCYAIEKLAVNEARGSERQNICSMLSIECQCRLLWVSLDS